MPSNKTLLAALSVAVLVACSGNSGSEDHPGMDTYVDETLDPGTDPGPGTEIIEPYRRTHWDPGVRGGLPAEAEACPAGAASVTDFGATGDGATDDSEAFEAAIDAAEDGSALLIPAGTYLIGSGLTIGTSLVLCGEGPEASRLVFDTDSLGIDVVTYQRGDFVDVHSGLTRWSTEIVVQDASSFSAGDYAELQQDNDWALMDPEGEWRDASWVPEASVGQMFRIVSVDGDTLSVEPPVHFDYNPDRDPVIRPLGLVDGVGLQGLGLSRTDSYDHSTIQFKNAVNCWMRDCISEMTSRAHVSMTSALWCTVRDSWFEDSYDHGGGGHGYGTSLGHHVTDSLVENNVFVHLRHSMIIQDGASGNVFGYNHSSEPYQSEGGDWSPCDISLHGHYLLMNLFEGNVAQEADVADYWGPAGPGNTFFRNRIEAEGIQIMDHSHGQNVVANTLGTDPNVVSEDDTVTLNLIHGNYQDGAIVWDPGIASHDLPDSLYLTSKPAFFGDTPWPVTGADLAPSTDTIPAQDRHDSM